MNYGGTVTSTPLDWTLAQNTAARLARPGPKVPREQRQELVKQLRETAARSVDIVADTSLLPPANEAEVKVLDRSSWGRSAVSGVEAMIGPAMPSAGNASKLAALEVGGLFAVLSSRVLGQYDAWAGEAAGRLSLVAPNILATEQAIKADPTAFRTWVCMHEQTHAAQFHTAPWLHKYMAGKSRSLVASIMARQGARDRLATVLHGLVEWIRSEEAPTVLELAATEDELEVFDEITAVMSILEGHADVIMDDVGEDVVPGVERIRRAFNARREGSGVPRTRWDRILRKLLGLDEKIAQYREGADFVRAVEAQVGRTGFNAVWENYGNMPTLIELRNPQQWVDRVHG